MVDLSIVLYNSSNAQAWNFMPQVPYFNLFGISQLHMISQYSPMRYPDRKLSVSLQVHYRRHHRKSPCLLVKSPFLLMESHWISHNIYIYIYRYIHIIYRSHQITYIYPIQISHHSRFFGPWHSCSGCVSRLRVRQDFAGGGFPTTAAADEPGGLSRVMRDFQVQFLPSL